MKITLFILNFIIKKCFIITIFLKYNININNIIKVAITVTIISTPYDPFTCFSLQ